MKRLSRILRPFGARPLAAMTLAAMGAFWPVAHAGEMSMIACYLALANDLTPLVDASLPDSVAASPECASQTQPVVAKKRGDNVTRSNAGTPKATTKVDPPPAADADSRANASSATTRTSQKSTDAGASPK
jgi:hypothetical protein